MKRFVYDLEKLQLARRELHLSHILQPYCLTIADRFAHGYPCAIKDSPYSALIYSHPRSVLSTVPYEAMYWPMSVLDRHKNVYIERTCVRCSNTFLEETYPSMVGHCFHYSPNRKHIECSKVGCTTVENGFLPQEKLFGPIKSCELSSKDYDVYKQHVWSGIKEGLNVPPFPFINTELISTPDCTYNYGIYAIDCEMSFTVVGLELTKISVVNIAGNIVYDTYVLPQYPVIDYNTRYSGVTRENLAAEFTKSLVDVQRGLLTFINQNSILIGHGLENDLRVLRLIHKKVLDTSLLYPHQRGFPFRRSLKDICTYYLNKNIQCHNNGHRSREDAWSTMQLVLMKFMPELLTGNQAK